MRIERLDLLAYEELRETVLHLDASSGLTVVLGPNEAGKSTSVRALTSLLFGFPRCRGGRSRSLKVGGRLVASDGQALEIVRRGLAGQPLVNGDGQPLKDHELAEFMGRVERSTFSSLFCVSHEELHYRSAELLETGGQLGRLIFGAGLGGVSANALRSSLKDRAEALFKARGERQPVNRSLESYREHRRRSMELRVRSREWHRRHEDLLAATHEVDRCRQALAECQAERQHLASLRAALPSLARYAAARQRLEELERIGPLPPTTWAERTRDLLEERARVVDKATDQEGRVAKVRAALEHVEVPEALVEGAEAVRSLAAGQERYRKDLEDLPKRETRLRELDESVTEGLRRLGMTPEVFDVSDLELTDVEELADEGAAKAAARQSAEREHLAARARLEEAETAWASLPEPPEVGPLRERLVSASRLTTRASEVDAEEVRANQLEADLAASRDRLGFDHAVDLERLRLPTQEDLHERLETVGHEEEAQARLMERLTELGDEISSLEAERSRTQATVGLPGPETVAQARERRQETWRLVREAWLGPRTQHDLPPDVLAASYEASVAEADAAADLRYHHAADLARLGQLEERLSSLLTQRASLARKLDAQRQRAGGVAADFAAWWADAGLPPAETKAAPAFLSQVAEAQSSAREARRARQAVDAYHAQEQVHCAQLAAALGDLGIEPSSRDLVALADHAHKFLAQAEEASRRWTDLDRERRGARQVLNERSAAVERAAAEEEAWLTRWGAALQRLGLPPTTSPHTARLVTRDLRELRRQVRDAEGLRHRVEGLRRDVDAFVARAHATLARILPEIDQWDVLPAVTEASRRVDAALAAHGKRQSLLGQLENAQAEHAAIDQRRMALEVAIKEQRVEASLGGDEDLDGLVARALEAAQKLEIIDSSRQEVMEQTAMTLKEAAGFAASFKNDPSAIDERLATLEAASEDLSEALTAATEMRAEARRLLDAVDGAGQAAAEEQEQELALGSLAENAGEYARLVVALEVLRRVEDDYSRRHQGSILDRASAVFSSLTRGAFDGLLADHDGQSHILAAVRGHDLLHVDQLSDGTVDQLYLALRLAGIEHHLDRSREPLPVVLDDILVNFDDDRAAAAISALARLGERTQVILFTHHRHVAEIAMANTPERVGLAHFEAVDAGLGGSSAHSRSESAATRIVEALQAANVPLTKRELLAHSGVPEVNWPRTIRVLIEAGQVVKIGERRGTRYAAA